MPPTGRLTATPVVASAWPGGPSSATEVHERKNLDRHPSYLVAAYMASAT